LQIVTERQTAINYVSIKFNVLSSSDALNTIVYNRLTTNNITDLSNAGPSGHSHLLSFKITKTHTPIVSDLDPLLNQVLIDFFSKVYVVFQRLEIDGIKLEGNFIKKIDTGTKLLLEYLLYLYVLCPGSFL
jgi:hypothetical protein